MMENNFNNTVHSLFTGMDNFLSTKTVVGEAVHIGDTIILPLIEVTFGVGAGALAQGQKNSAGGGMGGKIVPSAVLVIQNGSAKLVNVKNQDSITKILDMVPEFVDKFSKKKGKEEKSKKDSENDIEAKNKAAEEMADILNINVENESMS